jgi:methylmalonyl-CoA mutase C-terminal domain/subunit
MSKRILIAKIGLDGHDRGAKIIINFLKESGYQVIYSGLHNTPQQIANIAFQEDVDAIGISILSGSHSPLLQELVKIIQVNSEEKILIFAGGTIPPQDIAFLEINGIDKIFPTGSSIESILDWLAQSFSSGKHHKSHDR